MRFLRPAARTLVHLFLAACHLPVWIAIGVWRRVSEVRGVLLWGPIPIINNKYWSAAMSEVGWESKTLVGTYFSSINRRSDYDVYFEDLVPRWVPKPFRSTIEVYSAFTYIVRHAEVWHMPFSGGPLGSTPLWAIEAHMLRFAGVRTVVLAYGADVYMYSRVTDPAVRNALLASYPIAARRERETARRVRYWSDRADVVLVGFTMDGVPRWDVPVGNMLCIDVREWTPKELYSRANGRDGIVRVLHAPNHRGLKGTEFIQRAVEELRKEGLHIELVLLERVQNDRLQQTMREVDLLADQLILPGYGMNAVEGMACGLPVLANLDDAAYTRVFRRYSFLDQCPILSTSPETIKENLRVLATEPILREQLGRAGRAYVEAFHSFPSARFLFGAIYRHLSGEQVDLANLYHPLLSEHPADRVPIEHPLIENRLPETWARTPAPFAERWQD